jgi:hypothetical protein
MSNRTHPSGSRVPDDCILGLGGCSSVRARAWVWLWVVCVWVSGCVSVCSLENEAASLN